MPRSADGMRPSALGLIVLGMLIEEPMHVYRMQKLIKERGKDKVVNVRQRTSLHQIIARLSDHQLVEQVDRRDDSDDASAYPERRVYAITPPGRRAAADWLAALITQAPVEYRPFPAALSVITMVTPAVAGQLLAARSTAIDEALAALQQEMGRADVPRVYLLEDEYQVRLLSAESDWLRALRDDIATGTLSWPAPPAGQPTRQR